MFPITLTFSGTQVTVAGEYVNAVPVPANQQEFAPLFRGARSITATISYDTAQPDTDADPNIGTYRIGALSVSIPELGLNVARNGSSRVQISAFNDVENTNDQFFAAVRGVDTFSNNVGLPTPAAVNVLVFGNTSMLADDSLPTRALTWNRGNASFDFVASDNTERQVLLEFGPAAIQTPEERIESVVASIHDLVAGGSLRQGQANGLLRPLENALRSLKEGKRAPACSQLEDFANEVRQKVIDGVLKDEEGRALIDSAEKVRQDLGCSA